MMVSTLTANLCLATGSVLHIVVYFVPFVAIPSDVYIAMTGGAKIALALIPNVAMWWGVKVIGTQEGSGEGAQFTNLFDRIDESDPISMGVVWIMMIVDILVYGFITWYIDSVKPGPYGVAQKWYFLFTVSNDKTCQTSRISTIPLI